MEKKKKDKLADLQNKPPSRVRFPRENQFVGIVDKRLGGSRMYIKMMDGKTLLARVPGKLRKSLWIRENDVVLVERWELSKDKGDLIYKYKPEEIKVLEKKNIFINLENSSEF